jgi:predicted  nucleic acid-binding Zn-ribbon protein
MSNNISDLDEVKSVDQLKRELTSLKRENIAAMKTIDKLLKDLHKKTEEISHLQSLVAQAVPVVRKEEKKIVTTITAEEEIATLQLERLRLAAKGRTLTLEETRMFDLLVKNKRLSQDESTVNLSKGGYRDVTDVELLKIAAAEAKDPDESEPK